MICHISFSKFSDAFSSFTWASATGNRWSIYSRVNNLRQINQLEGLSFPCVFFLIWDILISKLTAFCFSLRIFIGQYFMLVFWVSIFIKNINITCYLYLFFLYILRFIYSSFSIITSLWIFLSKDLIVLNFWK